MNIKRLTNLSIKNFRIFEKCECPLDADIVLIYGKNGSGKTSLLQAIEFAICGKVSDFVNLEYDYPRCLVNIGAQSANVSLTFKDDKNNDNQTSISVFNKNGLVTPNTSISEKQKQFLAERAYLSQTRLTRLLEAYQAPELNSKNKEQPVVRIVRELLGLDLLENITTGIYNIKHLARFRNTSSEYTSFLNEKNSLSQQLTKLEKEKTNLENNIYKIVKIIEEECNALGIKVGNLISENEIKQVQLKLKSLHSGKELSRLITLSSKVESINDRLKELGQIDNSDDLKILETSLKNLKSERIKKINKLKTAIDNAVISLNDGGFKIKTFKIKNIVRLFDEITGYLETKHNNYKEELSIKNKNDERLKKYTEQGIEIKNKMEELEKKTRTKTGNLVGQTNILEISLEYVDTEECPVCGRNYKELNEGSLKEHIKNELVKLGSDVKTLEEDSRKRSELAQELANVNRETLILNKQIENQKSAYAEAAKYVGIINLEFTKLEKLYDEYNDCIELNEQIDDIADSIIDLRTKDKEKKSIDKSINEIRIIATKELGKNILAETENTFLFQEYLEEKIDTFEDKDETLNNITEYLDDLEKHYRTLNQELAPNITKHTNKIKSFIEAEKNLNDLRSKINKLSDSSKATQETLLKRIFNKELNSLWKDIFLRLVKTETFFPNLSEPVLEYGKIRTKLQASTHHRKPVNTFENAISVLSSANANTASLSLFLALYLVERSRIPLLILDDPVQNMDDVHIINFAALMKRMVRETNRQLFLTVHDDELFEYLKMELAPKNIDESLLSIELSRRGETSGIIHNFEQLADDKLKIAS